MTSWSGAVTGSLRSRIWSISVNIAVLAPMPNASDRIATVEKRGLRRSPRIASRRSASVVLIVLLGRSEPAEGWLVGLNSFLDADFDLAALGAAKHADSCGSPDPRFSQHAVKIVETLHGLIVECHDQIPLPQAGGNRGPIGLQRDHEPRCSLIQPMEPCDPPQKRYVLTRHPQISATDASIAQERWQHGNYGTDGNGKTQPLPSG